MRYVWKQWFQDENMKLFSRCFRIQIQQEAQGGSGLQAANEWYRQCHEQDNRNRYGCEVLISRGGSSITPFASGTTFLSVFP